MFWKKKKEKKNEDSKVINRILVIGHRIDITGINSYPWDKIPNNLNFADYNKVIIDISQLSGEILYNLDFNLNYNFFNFLDLFKNHEAEVIIIGSPEILSYANDNWMRMWNPADLLPFIYKHKKISGNSFKLMDRDFEDYFNFIKSYEYQFEDNNIESNHHNTNYINMYCKSLGSTPDKTKIMSNSIAQNISKNDIAKYIRFEYENTVTRVVEKSATVLWLPSTTQDNKMQSIVSLLKRMGLNIESVVPEWIKEYSLLKIDREYEQLTQLNKEKEELLAKIDKINQNLTEERKYLRLLFENGEQLEDIVKKSLIQLGGKIIKKELHKEDLRIEDLQGRKGHFKREEIRQINEWHDNARLYDNVKGKKIIFGNYCIDIPLKKRNINLHAEDKELLIENSIALIYTPDLFFIISEFQKGKYVKEYFWDKIFNNNGLVSF